MAQAIAYRADGRTCSREDFYALACDPARSIVVEACAGAGKTWMLVSRILRALLAGVQPQEILAITFTRKAAGEMRERLRAWLAEFALATPEVRIEALRQRGVDERQAVRLEPQLARLHAAVLAGGRSVDIHTFHAWFSQLMRAAPHELLDRLGLQPGVALVEDIEELRPDLMRRFHASVAASAEALADYTALIERHGRSRLSDWLAAALDKRIELELADEAGRAAHALLPADPSGQSPLIRMHADAGLQAALDAAARALGAHKNKRPREAGAALRLACEEPDPQRAFNAAWRALFTQQGEAQKLGDIPELELAVEALVALRDAQDQHLAWLDHGRMLRLTRLLMMAWRELKRARALADMPDLERCALALLSDPVLSGWVQQRLDARVKQVLIDEFQDTSPLQWHALSAWLSSYAGAGGGASGQRPPAVFIVGDPKQSIYRFRRAEPRVFEAAREFVVQGLEGVVLECDHTRRNAPGVMAVLNQVFEAAAAAGEFTGYRTHSTEVAQGPAPAVRSLPEAQRPPRQKAGEVAAAWRDSLTTRRVEPEQQLRRAEAAQVAAAVCELVATGQAPGSIMVLSRKRAALGWAAEELRLRHVPCIAAEDLRLAELPEARDLIALLDVLASPAHDLALAQALKSPLFAASDDELLALSRRARSPRRPWLRALLEWDDAPGALVRARRLIGGWQRWLNLLPPHDLLDRIVHEADALARMVAAAPPERRGLARQAVQALLAQALELDGGRYATPYNFVRALRLRPVRVSMPGAPDAVQLLTVHGAKGLEADTVFLLDCDAEPPRGGQPTVMVDWPLHDSAPRCVAFVASEGRCPPSLRALDEAEAALRAREDLNVLYVAMTRARQRLVISRTPARSANPRAWWPRLAPLAQPWVPEQRQGASGGHGQAQVLQMPRGGRYAGGPGGLPTGGGAAAAAADEAAARLGQAVHRVLEWAAQPGAAMAELSALSTAAAREYGVAPALWPAVQQSAADILQSPALAAFFDPARLRWAGNEVPVALDGRSLRIDRLVQLAADGSWWVLDYKLHAAPHTLAAYREQLARYREAVASLQPGEAVHAAFITAGGRLVPLAAA
ncbi:MAG: UvrD-helicase domain-containing protein [Burkholderiales bacterium]|nr:UvrD-helicase domain-containing protein [Burkholderiales bacterium]